MSISSEELTQALKTIYHKWQNLEEETDWEEVKLLEQYGTTFLRITRKIQPPAQQTEEGETENIIEEDPEALQTPTTKKHVCVYDVVHSTSYQVPVIYITFRGLQRPSLDEVYQLLVPHTDEKQLRDVGIIGALSLCEHPVTGTPSYFVHPCRTQEAMEPLLASRRVQPEEYLMLWFGIVGGCVGLHVPVGLAAMIRPEGTNASEQGTNA